MYAKCVLKNVDHADISMVTGNQTLTELPGGTENNHQCLQTWWLVNKPKQSYLDDKGTTFMLTQNGDW